MSIGPHDPGAASFVHRHKNAIDVGSIIALVVLAVWALL